MDLIIVNLYQKFKKFNSFQKFDPLIKRSSKNDKARKLRYTK